MPSRPAYNTSYAISVRQNGILLTASFRPYLTVAALAVQLEIPVIKALRGLAPLSHFLAHFRLRVPMRQSRRFAPCLAHILKKDTFKNLSFFVFCCVNLFLLLSLHQRLQNDSYPRCWSRTAATTT